LRGKVLLDKRAKQLRAELTQKQRTIPQLLRPYGSLHQSHQVYMFVAQLGGNGLVCRTGPDEGRDLFARLIGWANG